MINLKENFASTMTPVFEGLRKAAEPPIQHWIESRGFVPFEEDRPEALTARIDTLRSFWVLNGLDYLVKFDESAVSQQPGIYDPRVDQFAEGILTNHWEQIPSDRLQSVLKRMMGVPSRKKLLMDTLSNIYGYGAPNEFAGESHRRLSMILDIAEGRVKKPTGNKRGVIFAQTAYILGDEIDGKKETNYPYGLDEWAKFAIQLGSGALPYMGAAVVYSELMSTGEFADIEFVDFRDEKRIEEISLRSSEYDLALVAGATTFDRFVIDDLNKKLSQSGLTVIKGGVAPTIDEEPERYMQNGASIFIGEFEGAAERLMEAINSDPSPLVFLREGSRSQITRVAKRNAPFTALPNLPDNVDMSAAYSDEREETNLAYRLEALEKMRITYTFGGKKYEANPFFKFHQTEVSKGCPEACTFCATVPYIGRTTRARPLESIEREWAATESPVIAIVDQNFHATGRDYVTKVLQIAEKLGKKLAFEGEALFFTEGKGQNHFFDGTTADEERKRLLKNTVVAIQVGLEQPVKVRGTVPGGKDPDQFPKALNALNDSGVIVFGTSIIGMPKELWAPGADNNLPIVPYEDMYGTPEWQIMIDTWVDWLQNKVPVPGSIPFAFTVVPGTPAKDILGRKGMLISNDPKKLIRRKELEEDLSPSVDPNVIKDPIHGLIMSRQTVEEVRREIYKWPNIRKRVDAANLSLKRKIFMYLVGIFSDRTLRDRMQ